MKIVQLTATNVKRLRAVEITPKGNLVIISGENGQGKSSVLDAIAFALGGKDLISEEPVHTGQKKAEITCDLGDYIVRRTITRDRGGTLTVEAKDGTQIRPAQEKINGLIGRLSFDPLEFANMDRASQADTLRKLVGLDFSGLDGRRTVLFDERTGVNRDGKALRARLDALAAPFEGAPEQEVSSAEVMAELERAQQVNRAVAEERRKLSEADGAAALAETKLNGAERRVLATREQIAELQKRLATEEKEVSAFTLDLNNARVAASDLKMKAKTLQEVDLKPINARLAGVEETNRRVRHNTTRAAVLAELNAKLVESTKLTEALGAIDQEKQAAIASAKFPVPELSFDAEGGVVFKGLPFSQAADSEKLVVSAGVMLAMNPTLRVLLIRQGVFLDSKAMARLGAWAEEHNAQVWIERVEDGHATVVIEDGYVVEAVPGEAVIQSEPQQAVQS